MSEKMMLHHLVEFRQVAKEVQTDSSCGGFLKWVYPQII
jgi:hypothetical protein